MNPPDHYSFQRYLRAKQDIDDRSLNYTVLEQLKEITNQSDELRTLELGAGIGTMLERLVDRKILKYGVYLGIDTDTASVEEAIQRVSDWSSKRVYQTRNISEGRLTEKISDSRLRIGFKVADALEYCTRQENTGAWDLLIAHAFLDLFDLPYVLPVFLQTLHPGGLFYFTLNFDGATSFEPLVDPCLDEQIITLYHRSMDERLVNGMPSGDSLSGRHLFHMLLNSGATILAAGSSDWVVYPHSGTYPGDEAYFLHHILHFFEQTLCDHPELDAARFSAWLDTRHSQVDRGELVYIAHQIDILGRRI
jgi:SAM-dependent methyltransferase